MKLQEDGIHGQVGAINVLKKTIMIILFIHMQSCVMEPRGDLKLKLVNLSKDKIYVGNLYECDSCEIQRDVRFHCSNRKSDPPMLRILNKKDSVQLEDKLTSNSVKIYAINADSLDEYCNRGRTDNITKKPWVQLLSGNVDKNKKTCRIVIR